jgi:predicted membrane protein
MLLCWGVVYIAVETHHQDKVNTGCMKLNPDWTLQQCDDRRNTAAIIAIVLVTVGMLFGIYFTLVLSRWVSSIEWAEHLDEEKRLADWRAGKAENPHIKAHFVVEGRVSQECT